MKKDKMPVMSKDAAPTPNNHHQSKAMDSVNKLTDQPIKPNSPTIPMIDGKMRMVLWYSMYTLIQMAEQKKSITANQNK